MDFKSAEHRLRPRADFKLPADFTERCGQFENELAHYDRKVTSFALANEFIKMD